MIYVLDTGVFRELISHLPKKGKMFEALWDALEKGINCGDFISVDECLNELELHFSENADQFCWIKSHKEMFINPDNEESLIIRSLLQKPKMRECVHQKNILSNRPSADVYIAAKAKRLEATVVTTEKQKPHSAQLPNVCEELRVPCISYDDFMEILDGMTRESG